MPFNPLILTCLHDCTSFKDNGVEIKCSKPKDSSILFFVIDKESNPRSSLLKDINMSGRICDLIVYYDSLDKKVICFVELKKGSNSSDGREQIINTYNYFKKYFEQSIKNKECKKAIKITYKSYIKTMGSSLKNTKEDREILIKAFGKENVDISRDSDITSFLKN